MEATKVLFAGVRLVMDLIRFSFSVARSLCGVVVGGVGVGVDGVDGVVGGVVDGLSVVLVLVMVLVLMVLSVLMVLMVLLMAVMEGKMLRNLSLPIFCRRERDLFLQGENNFCLRRWRNMSSHIEFPVSRLKFNFTLYKTVYLSLLSSDRL